jgi:predicted RNase H-like nuclease
MKFLGIDLGWQSQPSGLCCLVWQQQRLRLLQLERLSAVSEILLWVDTWVVPDESAVIAVDAPTLISNPTGMRLADRLAHKHFGRYHAGCYPANLARPFAARTVEFGRSLAAKGFVHAPRIIPQRPGRYQIEVFPHPATVQLFGLNQILKYKKGRLAERRAELSRYRDYILAVLPTLEPALILTQPDSHLPLLPEIPLKGTDLKALEDQLDSLICAYVAAHWWYWGLERNLVLGAPQPEICATEGYIVVPMRVEAGSRSQLSQQITASESD